MVRRAQMQKQMDISSTKADKLLKKAKKMNNRMFEKGGANMATEKKLSAEEQIEKIVRGRDWKKLTWADRKKIGKIIEQDKPNREMKETRRHLGALKKQRDAGVPQPKPRTFRDFSKQEKILKKMAQGGVGEDPFKGDKPTGKTDKKGRKQYKRPDGTTYFRLFGGDDEKRNVGGILDLLKPSMGAATGSGQSIEQKGMPRRIKKIKPKEQKGMPKRTKKIELKEKKLSEGGALKAIPSENKGLPNLPKEVRNKMGYMKDGGTAQNNNAKKSRGAGAMIKGTTFRGVF